MSGFVVHIDASGIAHAARMLGEAVLGAVRVPGLVVRRH
ncbi:MAG: hypothetical protein JWR20_1501 [Marmoricola sp.]|nr:hypothetical protein [Marmoricola sp.]